MGGSTVYRVRHSLISYSNPDVWWGMPWVEPTLYVSFILSFLLHSHCCHKILVTSSIGPDLNVDSLSLSWSISHPNVRVFLLQVTSRTYGTFPTRSSSWSLRGFLIMFHLSSFLITCHRDVFFPLPISYLTHVFKKYLPSPCYVLGTLSHTGVEQEQDIHGTFPSRPVSREARQTFN